MQLAPRYDTTVLIQKYGLQRVGYVPIVWYLVLFCFVSRVVISSFGLHYVGERMARG